MALLLNFSNRPNVNSYVILSQINTLLSYCCGDSRDSSVRPRFVFDKVCSGYNWRPNCEVETFISYGAINMCCVALTDVPYG